MKKEITKKKRQMDVMKHKDELLEIIRQLKKSSETDALLQDLLTPKEYHDLTLRWQIVKRLAKGETQRTIARELGVGIATVIRGARAFNESKGGFRSLLS